MASNPVAVFLAATSFSNIWYNFHYTLNADIIDSPWFLAIVLINEQNSLSPKTVTW